jgi:solute carrier family 25 oxoglutarate transporter 11
MKTKLQKMKKTNGVYPYSGVVDCLTKTVSREGVLGPWVGLPVYFVRVAP